MSGIQEILVLVIIILGIFFVPRMMTRRKETEPVRPAVELSGRMRLSIAASIFWPAMIAAFLKPWRDDLFSFLYIGVGPVALAWIVFWVFVGFRKR